LFPHPALPCSYSFEYGSMAAILTAIFLSWRDLENGSHKLAVNIRAWCGGLHE
jgi:hypothetical protein